MHISCAQNATYIGAETVFLKTFLYIHVLCACTLCTHLKIAVYNVHSYLNLCTLSFIVQLTMLINNATNNNCSHYQGYS